MLNLSLKQDSSTVPKPMILNVERLTNFDLPYVYHFIRAGIPLKLIRKSNMDLLTDRVSVYYRNYKIGEGTLTPEMVKQMGMRQNAEACVHEIHKEKYMPINKLEIQLTL